MTVTTSGYSIVNYLVFLTNVLEILPFYDINNEYSSSFCLLLLPVMVIIFTTIILCIML